MLAKYCADDHTLVPTSSIWPSALGVHSFEDPVVDRGQLPTFVRVGHEHEVPPLAVRSRGSLQSEIETLEQHFPLDRTLEVQASTHRPGRREQLIDGEVKDLRLCRGLKLDGCRRPQGTLRWIPSSVSNSPGDSQVNLHE
jgi:hypothetical protein